MDRNRISRWLRSQYLRWYQTDIDVRTSTGQTRPKACQKRVNEDTQPPISLSETGDPQWGTPPAPCFPNLQSDSNLYLLESNKLQVPSSNHLTPPTSRHGQKSFGQDLRVSGEEQRQLLTEQEQSLQCRLHAGDQETCTFVAQDEKICSSDLFM